MSHQQVIRNLFDMKVPGWLLLILISYLSDRKMMMKFRGVLSSLHLLPGSSPQGTVLGVLLFIIYFNGAALRPSIPRPSWPIFSKKTNDPVAIKVKFVDDLSVAVKVNLEKDLVSDFSREQPLTFDQRMEIKIADSANTLQTITDSLVDFSSQRQMVINTKKTCVMKFCKSRTVVFPTEIRVDDDFLELKKELKILGVIIQPNLKWGSNTDYICKKAYKNLWTLRRMKTLGLDSFTMLDYYMKEVRVHLELAVPVWHSGLTQKLSADIERVQRVAVGILINNAPYANACATLGLKPLSIRRLELCQRFAVNTASDKSRHSDLFKLVRNGAREAKSDKRLYREHMCKKSRFYNSPLPFLTRTLNQL